jgi:flagellar biosynthesis protein FlhG
VSVIPKDQAAELRMLMESRVGAARSSAGRRKAAHVVAIASGKGGVGKTNIAANLAICLSRRGLRVILVDADLGMANVDVIMNVQPTYDLSHVIRGERTIDDIVVRIDGNLRLVAGASGLASIADLSPFGRQELISELGSLETQADVMILDCGAGISQNVLAFAHSANELMIVTTPEPTALTDAYALIKVLSRAPRPPSVGLVVNQSVSAREGHLVAQRVASVAARFLGIGLTTAGLVLHDQHVPLAVRQRVPFVVKYPDSPASTCIAALAERIDRSLSARSLTSGFFKRVARFFY